MDPRISIRAYTPADLDQIISLHARIQPYRPGDEAAVVVMYARAAQAQRTSDRWVAPRPGIDRIDDIAGSYAAFWVAVAGDHDIQDIIGMIGVRRGVDPGEVGDPACLVRWRARDDVAELRRLRVAPEWSGRGIGLELTATVIAWSRRNGFSALVLNTTTPQAPARALYAGLGFREVCQSYLGHYELVWYELAL